MLKLSKKTSIKTQNSGTMFPNIATMNTYKHKSQNKRSIDAHRSLLRCVTCRRFLNMVIKPMPTVFAFNCSKCCGTLGIISDVFHDKSNSQRYVMYGWFTETKYKRPKRQQSVTFIINQSPWPWPIAWFNYFCRWYFCRWYFCVPKPSL